MSDVFFRFRHMAIKKSLEIESENHHVGFCAVHRLGINELVAVAKVLTVFVEYVGEPYTELQFRNQLEERQIEVAA